MSLLNREIWGPALWTCLHTFAEFSGKQSNPLQDKDEGHAWLNLFKNLQDIMPCALCSAHYKTYIRHHPVSSVVNLKGYQRREWLIDYLFNFHNAVNTLLGKPLFSKDNLGVYDDRDKFKSAFTVLRDMGKKAIDQNQLKLMSLNVVLKNFDLIRKFYGLI
jgi:hypothetical protein